MTREEARQYINNRLPHELTKAPKVINGCDSYIYPFCGNGSGEDGTGICTTDGKHYKCFKCGFYGDYLDILKKKHDKVNENEIFALYSLMIDGNQPGATAVRDTYRHRAQPVRREESIADYTRYFAECHAGAGQTDYFSSRGIGRATVDRFKLGYDPAWKHPNATNAPETDRVIIPTARLSYTARAIDPDVTQPKMKVGPAGLFNARALQSTDSPYIFIVEGEFDVLSVAEVGGQAVGLGSTSNMRQLVEAVKNNPPSSLLVLALDNDVPGKKAQAILKEQLEASNIRPVEANISGAYTDPNEALQRDREGFTKLVKDPCKLDECRSLYVKTNAVSGCLEAFAQTIRNASDVKAIPTGFKTLDGVLDGGLYEGLYIIGSVSSIGKTTFCLQVADQIAQGDEDAILFSLEMSKDLLISKSLSHLTFDEDNGKDDMGVHYARTSRQIMSGIARNDREKALLDSALQRYRDYSRNLYICEGMADIGVKEIQERVGAHISVTGRRPAVIIDYLQILTPFDLRATDKQNTDKSVLELKRMSMEHKIPVLVVSSFNRDNYMNPVNMTSFKESGAIEYSSDVLLGLQFKGMDELSQASGKVSGNMKTIDEWRRSECRELELKILKNRNGPSGDSIYFSYYPRFNFFVESSKPATATAARRARR